MKSTLHRVSVHTHESDHTIEAEAVRIGTDALDYSWSGERTHTGAVAAAQPRPSLSDPNKTSAPASVLTYLAHKDDTVAKSMAEAVSGRLWTNVAVTAGIHWDNLPAQGIAVVMDGCREIADLLGHALEHEDKS
jgi:gallate decarboxylase subunit D